MIKWEHRVVSIDWMDPPTLEQWLNREGEEGWQFCGEVGEMQIMKRPITVSSQEKGDK